MGLESVLAESDRKTRTSIHEIGSHPERRDFKPFLNHDFSLSIIPFLKIQALIDNGLAAVLQLSHNRTIVRGELRGPLDIFLDLLGIVTADNIGTGRQRSVLKGFKSTTKTCD